MTTSGFFPPNPLHVAPATMRQELIEAANWVADYLEQLPDRHIVREPPAATRRSLGTQALPESGETMSDIRTAMCEIITEYPIGDGHPGFFGWISPAPSPAGIIAEFIATAVNSNCGGRAQVLVDIERGSVRTLAQLAGMPADSGGVLTSGGSSANLLGLVAARAWRLEREGATDGAAFRDVHSRLVCYQSEETHVSVTKAARVIGLASDRLRTIACDEERRMDVAALERAIRADLSAGLLPFCVVSTLGTVTTGAIDPGTAIGRLCREYGIWHHGDGAYGGLGRLVLSLASEYEFVGQLDSLTIDPHKTLCVPIDCGVALFRDPGLLRRTFALRPSYIRDGDDIPWPADHTWELSRPGGRALKLWATLRQLGQTGVSALLQQYQDLAQLLVKLVENQPDLECRSSGPLPVICFRYIPADRFPDPSGFHSKLAVAVTERGKVSVSTVELDGQVVLRACVTNYRTGEQQLHELVQEVLVAGKTLQGV